MQSLYACHLKTTNNGNFVNVIGLASIVEAINAEKLFCEYFSTTEAEAVETQPTKPKNVKQNKKPPVKVIERAESRSESESEVREVRTLTDFNTCFVSDKPSNIISEAVDDVSFVSEMQIPEIFDLNNMLNGNENMFSPVDAESEETANVTILSDITLNGPDNNFVAMERQTVDFNEASTPVLYQLATTSDQSAGSRCCSLGSCKCYQKLSNKMEWLQKKIFNEFNSIRGEIIANRQLFIDHLTSTHRRDGEQTNVVQDEDTENTTQLTDAEFEVCNATYKKDFPIHTSDALLEFNVSDDEKFKKFVVSKLEKLQGANETKTTRKILQSLCDVYCMSEYTWIGTKTKKCFSKLQWIVDMIVGIIETKYPKCDSNEVLKSVVQQRTKSAAEKVEKINAQKKFAGESESAQNDNHSNEQPVATEPIGSSQSPFTAQPTIGSSQLPFTDQTHSTSSSQPPPFEQFQVRFSNAPVASAFSKLVDSIIKDHDQN